VGIGDSISWACKAEESADLQGCIRRPDLQSEGKRPQIMQGNGHTLGCACRRDSCGCKHLPHHDHLTVGVVLELQPAKARMPYRRWRVAAPLHYLLDLLHSQSNHDIWPSSGPYQRAPGMRKAHFDLGGGGFQTFIPTGDCCPRGTSEVFVQHFAKLVQCAEPHQLHRPKPSRRELGLFLFQYGLVGFFSDCGALCASMRGSTGRMGDRPGQHDHVSMAGSKRCVP
jgi:hypothetical protein